MFMLGNKTRYKKFFSTKREFWKSGKLKNCYQKKSNCSISRSTGNC